MYTKIPAAQVATRAGIDVVIAAGGEPTCMAKILAGEAVGTLFKASSSPLETRKRWIFGAPPAGEIRIDQGASEALREGKRSLLPKGILSVNGIFSRGEVVRIVDPSGKDMAHGVSRYGSEALSLISGRHPGEIESLLGYEYGPVDVHRDDLIMLGGTDA